jgi:hypothetical protein
VIVSANGCRFKSGGEPPHSKRKSPPRSPEAG